MPEFWLTSDPQTDGPWSNGCWTPPWGSYGGINDRFAIMGRDAAQAYMTAFDRIKELLDKGCPFHPETLTRAAVELTGDPEVIQKLVCDFKIRRLPDTGHPSEWFVPEPILGIELLRASLTGQ